MRVHWGGGGCSEYVDDLDAEEQDRVGGDLGTGAAAVRVVVALRLSLFNSGDISSFSAPATHRPILLVSTVFYVYLVEGDLVLR